MTLFQDNLSPYLTVVEQGSTPASPSAGDQKLFIRTSDHLLCYVNSSGTVTPVSAGGSGSITASGYTQNTARLLGRTTASAGAIEEITVGSGLTLSAGSLTASAAAGGLVGVHAYHNGSDTGTFTTTSASLVDVDATNMAVTVTVPSSGNVLIQLSALSQCTNRINWGIRVASSNVGIPCEVTSGNTGDARIHTVNFYLTGQSAGSTTYKWAWSTGSGATATIYTGPTYGDAIMSVWGN